MRRLYLSPRTLSATRAVAYRALMVTAVLALTCWLSLPVMGQSTTGTLTGLVTDPQGAIVSGATITLINSATRIELKSTSNDSGEFVFPQVPPGKYSLSVEATNFKKALATDLTVEVGTTSRTTVVLEVGSVTEQVTITATQDIVNSTTPTLTSVINTRQVQDLPLPTRNPLDLAGLQPGVAVIGDGTRGSSISGLRQTSVHLTQDGINAMDNFVKTSSLFALTAPSLNSTSEFSITTGTNDSGSGRGVGQVRLVTRGGTNDFHGDVFYLNRNDYFQANSFFNNLAGTPRARQNQHFFGFALGGPMFGPRFGEGGPAIWNGRDRAFWFFSYEGFRENFSATRNRTVLTEQARTGIFRYTGANGQLTSVNLLTIGNAGALNPITLAQLNAMPLPNNNLNGDTLNTAGFRYNVTGKDVNDKYVFRYDHVLVQDSAWGSHKLEFVFNRATFNLSPDTFNAIEAPFPGGIDVFQASTRSLATIALHSTFGSVTNELRYGRQWAPVNFLRAAPPDKPFFTTFAAVTNFDNVQMGQGRETIVTQWIDNMAIPKGAHTFRLGVDYQQVFADTFNDAGIHPNVTLGSNTQNSSGIINGDFPNLPAGATGNNIVTRAQNVFADITGFLASATATFNVTTPTSGFVPGATRSRIFKQRDLGLYVQDQWRAKPNLSLNFGVRWDYQGVPTIPNGLAIQVTNINDVFGVSGPNNLFNPNAAPGSQVTGQKATLDFVSGDTGKGLWNNDWNNFAPFFGFAYSPDFKEGFLAKVFGPTGTSSFRGGYSISYLHDGFTVVSNALGTGTTNPGLIQVSSNTTPQGVLSGGGVPLVTPSFVMPITDRQNFLANPNNALWAIEPNLRIPYVQQWSFGYEREITRNMAFEIRYAANHGVKVWRANNFNEVNIFENGFLKEFINAQKNLAARGGASFAPGCGGCVALPIFDKFFTQGGLPAGQTTAGQYSNATSISNLLNNNVGTLANTLAFSTTYRLNRENVALGIPANFFAANPNAAGITVLGNDSFSNYHSLQAEIRRRFSGGLQFQADYTFSKAMTDAPGALGNNQSDLTSFRTLRDKHLDYMRSSQDQTHRFVFNSIYDLPIGRGRKYLSNANGFVDRVVGGWTASSIVVWATRPPWFIASNRATVNQFNAANNPADLVGMSFEEFKSHLGIFRHPTGIYFIDPALLNITTTASGAFQQSTAKAGLFAAPAPGFFGNFPMNSLNGPRYFNIDASLVKRIPITETVKGELKTTFINVLNNPNFVYSGQNFDSTSFGRITTTSGSPRVIHFTLKVTW
ncbi:MAG TPA: carboxypeptidase regulatory-like domain-containing protein [Pyrinomonadaceae bacterium]|nr:carboxypeptidase regulatory-like domain-containing protein [Pyrinomonadaceae bacterium]